MSSKKKNLALAFAVAAAVAAPSAFATNGYFTEGIGTVNRGMAGAGVALPQEALSSAVNPAGLTDVGNQWEIAAGIFAPKRHYEISGNSANLNNSQDGDENPYFFIPSFAYSAKIDSQSAWGISAYGNGGMQTKYKDNVFASFCGGSTSPGCTSDTGVDLSQLFINATYAHNIPGNGSLGVSAIVAYQMFKAYGLGAFDNLGFSTSPGNVTNNGYDNTTGFGVKVGGLWHLTDTVNFGIAYTSKIKGKFDKYKGLFADDGEFDIPSNYTAGVAWKITPDIAVALDYMKIKYSDSKSVSNSSSNILNAPGFGGTDPNSRLGGSDGAGFGWQDINVWKLGAQFKADAGWTWRVGVNHGDNPIRDTDVLINILAPGVVQDHLNFGFTKAIDQTSDFNFMFDHAFKKTVTGDNPIQFGGGGPSGGQTSISLEENYVEVGYSKKF